jgi:hypothetical protein
MSNKKIRVISVGGLVIYSALAIYASLAEIDPLLFCLGLPWSVIASILSPFIGHSFGAKALNQSLLLCDILNMFIIAKIVFGIHRGDDDL